MKNRLYLIILIGFLLIQGCNVKHTYLRFTPKTEPGGALIYREGHPEEKARRFYHLITKADVEAGQVKLPNFVFEKEGFLSETCTPSVFKLNREINRTVTHPSRGFGSYCFYHENEVSIKFKRDPSFVSPENKTNLIMLTVNSEPQGARIYEEGAYKGTTPLKLEYAIASSAYRNKNMQCNVLLAIHDACLPQKQSPSFQIDPLWALEENQTYYYATLFLLERDPNYNPPPVVTRVQQPNDVNITVTQKKDKDALDALEQMSTIGVLLRALKTP